MFLGHDNQNERWSGTVMISSIHNADMRKITANERWSRTVGNITVSLLLPYYCYTLVI